MVSRQIVPTNPMTFGESKQWQVSNGNDGISKSLEFPAVETCPFWKLYSSCASKQSLFWGDTGTQPEIAINKSAKVYRSKKTYRNTKHFTTENSFKFTLSPPDLRGQPPPPCHGRSSCWNSCARYLHPRHPRSLSGAIICWSGWLHSLISSFGAG